MSTPRLQPTRALTAPVGMRRGLAIYQANPFIDDTYTIKTRRRSYTVAKGATIIDATTGQVEGETTVAQIREVDAEQFVKIFTASIAVMFDLSADANRCYLLLFRCVQGAPNTDTIDMDFIKAQAMSAALTGKAISERAYYRGMKELAAAGVVASSVRQGWYFINPAMLFNGDRARFLIELRRKRDEHPAPAHVPALAPAFDESADPTDLFRLPAAN